MNDRCCVGEDWIKTAYVPCDVLLQKWGVFILCILQLNSGSERHRKGWGCSSAVEALVFHGCSSGF